MAGSINGLGRRSKEWLAYPADPTHRKKRDEWGTIRERLSAGLFCDRATRVWFRHVRWWTGWRLGRNRKSLDLGQADAGLSRPGNTIFGVSAPSTVHAGV